MPSSGKIDYKFGCLFEKCLRVVRLALFWGKLRLIEHIVTIQFCWQEYIVGFRKRPPLTIISLKSSKHAIPLQLSYTIIHLHLYICLHLQYFTTYWYKFFKASLWILLWFIFRLQNIINLHSPITSAYFTFRRCIQQKFRYPLRKHLRFYKPPKVSPPNSCKF